MVYDSVRDAFILVMQSNSGSARIVRFPGATLPNSWVSFSFTPAVGLPGDPNIASTDQFDYNRLDITSNTVLLIVNVFTANYAAVKGTAWLRFDLASMPGSFNWRFVFYPRGTGPNGAGECSSSTRTHIRQ